MRSGQELLGISQNGKRVYFDPINSHAALHFADAPDLKDLVIEVLAGINLVGKKPEFEVNMGRVIGTTDVIEVNEADEIVYAMRQGRKEQGYVPFTKSRYPACSSYISLSLVVQDNQTYILASAWIGRLQSPPFPGDLQATIDSKSYWSKHAFIWGSQRIISGTETSRYPW